MRRQLTWCVIVMALVPVLSGCVERKLMIRSQPSGAPVYIDEKYVGQTQPEFPLEYPFAHYGARRVRVGPIRGEEEMLLYAEKQRVVPVRAPWYETFPLDFFFEAIWPWTLHDVHRLAVFELEPAPATVAAGEERAREVLENAEALRKQAAEELLTLPGDE